VSRTRELPRNLLEAVRYFSDLDVANEYVAALRWSDGPVCPRCEGREHSYISTRRIWKCKSCKRQFSVKVGTIFEDSPLGLDKWLPAVWLAANSKNGISSHELGRALGVTQKSAWFMLHRIRLAMQTGSFLKLSGEVEVDETYIGGKARNMHKAKRAEKIHGRGPRDKTPVIGSLERGGRVHARVLKPRVGVNHRSVQGHVREHVEPGTTVYTDEGRFYSGLEVDYDHRTVNHAERYVDGRIHTNGIENFWALLKRGLRGTYVSVEPFHLFRYLDERCFTYNERDIGDLGRFEQVLRAAPGRRLTYESLTGRS
jgi:transposase-like protein